VLGSEVITVPDLDEAGIEAAAFAICALHLPSQWCGAYQHPDKRSLSYHAPCVYSMSEARAAVARYMTTGQAPSYDDVKHDLDVAMAEVERLRLVETAALKAADALDFTGRHFAAQEPFITELRKFKRTIPPAYADLCQADVNGDICHGKPESPIHTDGMWALRHDFVPAHSVEGS
jgi:hypothetical protein